MGTVMPRLASPSSARSDSRYSALEVDSDTSTVGLEALTVRVPVRRRDALGGAAPCKGHGNVSETG